jgi:hypothetical protein
MALLSLKRDFRIFAWIIKTQSKNLFMNYQKCAAILGGSLLALTSSADALTYGLAWGNENWPADKRSAIIAAMDQAVATYNRYGFFDKHVTANYNAGVPTAQANYDGWIDFGGSIGTRVALHEIGHTMGVGTYWSWGGNSFPAANARVKLYDGQWGGVGADGAHFWPYGMNFDSEDTGEVSRERHVKVIAALRRDMGIVGDADGDGMPDDWEIFNFGNTSQTASSDPDGDGVSNLDEYASDSNPNRAGAISGVTYRLRAEFSNKYIDVGGASTVDGGDVVQGSSSSSQSQRWIATHLGGGWFKFENANSGKVLETSGMGMNDGDNVVQWSWLNNYGQQWRLAEGGNGYWRLCNRQSGKTLDVYGFDSNDGANIVQWTDFSGVNQHWALESEAQVPAPWLTSDIGTTGLQGSAQYANGAFTVKGAGSLGGSTDCFHYTYQSLSGDGSIVARISTLGNTGSNARVGIMIRDTLANNSRMATLSVNGSGAFKWMRRTNTGGNVSTTNSSSGSAPNLWVRLVRSGNTITASKSTNGTSWTTIGSATVTMASNCYVGLAVASGSATTLNTSVFENVTAVP